MLRAKIVEFVGHADFGLASGPQPDGTYQHVWHDDLISPADVTFDSGVFLLTKAKAKSLKSPPPPPPKLEKKEPGSEQVDKTMPESEETAEKKKPEPEPKPTTRTFRLSGAIPSEVWNRLGTKLISKLRSGTDLRVGVNFSVTFGASSQERRDGNSAGTAGPGDWRTPSKSSRPGKSSFYLAVSRYRIGLGRGSPSRPNSTRRIPGCSRKAASPSLPKKVLHQLPVLSLKNILWPPCGMAR